MEQFFTYIYVIVVVLLLFGAAIFVHEWGHYWVALKRGMKVEEFAIGFGPKLYSWKFQGVLWSLRAIPAGGFVKLPQMITAEALEGGTDSKEPLPVASPLTRILVAFAGPFMNVVFAFAIAGLIYFVGLPVAVNPSLVGYVDPESPEYALGIREGDRIVEVHGTKVDSWQEVQQEAVLAPSRVLDVVIERDGVRQTYQLDTKTSEALGIKLLDLNPKDHPTVIQILAGQPGEAAGLQLEDVVLSFGGVPVSSQMQLIELIQKRPNQMTEMVVEREGEQLKLAITPRLDEAEQVGKIGVGLSPAATVFEVQKPGPTPVAQVTNVLSIMKKTFTALWYSEETGVGAKDLSGPVGILGNLAIQVKTDYRLALSFMVLLNINLAILNLLPIPVLDGGHITMAIYEAIFKSPVSLRVQEYATTFFALLLISFMLYVTFFDFKRASLLKSIFDRDVQVEPGRPATEPAESPAP